MAIRNGAKAIIIDNGKILLDHNFHSTLGEYYSLPGGGQHKYESMADAVVRECLEETGYTVVPERLAALSEEIYTSDVMRTQHSEYAHGILHIFICTLADVPKQAPTEQDAGQCGCKWIELSQLDTLTLWPTYLPAHMDQIINGGAPVFLGTHLIDL